MTEIMKNPQVLDLAEKVGSFMEYWGFKQIHGKVWTLVYLANTPVDANYLKDSLKVSKALTSMTIKDLVHYKVILEVAKEKPGTQKYEINPNITQVILDVLKARELDMISQTEQSFDQLHALYENQSIANVDSDRLDQLGLMISTAHFLLKGMISGDLVDFKKFGESTLISE